MMHVLHFSKPGKVEAGVEWRVPDITEEFHFISKPISGTQHVCALTLCYVPKQQILCVKIGCAGGMLK